MEGKEWEDWEDSTVFWATPTFALGSPRAVLGLYGMLGIELRGKCSTYCTIFLALMNLTVTLFYFGTSGGIQVIPKTSTLLPELSVRSPQLTIMPPHIFQID